MKEFADDNFEFDENDAKFSKWVENTAEKGEIAYYQQSLLLQQRFQILVLQTRKNSDLFGRGFNNRSLKIHSVEHSTESSSRIVFGSAEN